jgi:hypothetical protein
MIKKVDDLVNSNQEMQAGLTELTGQELSEINGGFAAIVSLAEDPALGALAGSIVFGKAPSDSLDLQLASIGVPRALVQGGNSLANSAGGGRYTGPVTAAKLG